MACLEPPPHGLPLWNGQLESHEASRMLGTWARPRHHLDWEPRPMGVDGSHAEGEHEPRRTSCSISDWVLANGVPFRRTIIRKK